MTSLPLLVPVLLPTGSLADVQLAKLFSVVGFLAIPVGILSLLVLYQLLLFAISSLECFTLAKYEIAPILQHCRMIAQQVDELSTTVNSGVKAVEGSLNKTVASAKPLLKTGEHFAGAGFQKLVFATNWLKRFFN
jgi:hypothetical protein